MRQTRWAIVFADDIIPDATGADERGHVNRRAGLRFETSEIIGECPPILCDSEVFGLRFRFLDESIVHRCDRASFACNLRRHALQDLAGSASIHQDVEFGLAQQIDESRGDDQVRCINSDDG